jgi:hypothetical protein
MTPDTMTFTVDGADHRHVRSDGVQLKKMAKNVGNRHHNLMFLLDEM